MKNDDSMREGVDHFNLSGGGRVSKVVRIINVHLLDDEMCTKV